MLIGNIILRQISEVRAVYDSCRAFYSQSPSYCSRGKETAEGEEGKEDG